MLTGNGMSDDGVLVDSYGRQGSEDSNVGYPRRGRVETWGK
jgi:hypothetical protein